MDLPTIRAYLAALDAMRRDETLAPYATELVNELAHPLNTIAELLEPIHTGRDLNRQEAELRRRAQALLKVRGIVRKGS